MMLFDFDLEFIWEKCPWRSETDKELLKIFSVCRAKHKIILFVTPRISEASL